MGDFPFKKVKQCKPDVKCLMLLGLCFFMVNCSSNSPKFVLETDRVEISKEAVNINRASAEELENLPNIGAKTAVRIIEHRERFGKFRRPEHLLLIEGISDKRFRNMRTLIRVE